MFGLDSIANPSRSATWSGRDWTEISESCCRVLKSWDGRDLPGLAAYMTENARLNKLLSAALEQRDRYKAMFMLASSGNDLGELV